MSLAVAAAIVGAVLGTVLGHERLAEVLGSSGEPPAIGDGYLAKVTAAAPGPSECTPPQAAPSVDRSDVSSLGPSEVRPIGAARADVPTLRFEDLPLTERADKEAGDRRAVPARNRRGAKTGGTKR